MMAFPTPQDSDFEHQPAAASKYFIKQLLLDAKYMLLNWDPLVGEEKRLKLGWLNWEKVLYLWHHKNYSSS